MQDPVQKAVQNAGFSGELLYVKLFSTGIIRISTTVCIVLPHMNCQSQV